MRKAFLLVLCTVAALTVRSYAQTHMGGARIVATSGNPTTLNGAAVPPNLPSAGTYNLGQIVAGPGLGNGTTVIDASTMAGANLGAQIAAADSLLGASSGKIVVSQSGTVSTRVTLSPGHSLEGVNDEITLTLSTTSSRIVQSSNTRVSHLTFTSAQTTTGAAVSGQGVTNIEADHLTFIGGGHHIGYHTVAGFRISDIRIVSMTASTSPIQLYQCSHGTISFVRAESFVMIAPNTARVIWVQQSSYVDVISPVIKDVDGSTIPTFAGVSFSGSNHVNLSGGQISGLINGDGFVSEAGTTYFSVVGTSSTGNGGAGGAGSYHNTGDGFDIFNSGHGKIVRVDGSGNGLEHGHINLEIFTSNDIDVSEGNFSGGGSHGIIAVGSPRVRFSQVSSNGNRYAGVNISAAAGTVNTNGAAVTRVSGIPFGLAWPANTVINISGTNYAIASVTDASHLVLMSSAGVQTEVRYTVDSYDFQIVGGEYSGNGLSGGGKVGQEEGIYLANSSQGVIQGVTATDLKGTKTQAYGCRIENRARAVLIGNNFRGNLSGAVRDSVGRSITTAIR